MYIYNVTIKVDHSISDDWLSWLKNEHVPDMIQTGCFTHATILQLLETGDEDGVTYAIQYHAANKSDYERYIQNFAGNMRNKSLEKWGDRVIAFRSFMKVVN